LGLITAEAMTLANKLANHEITKSQLIDSGFNRFSFDDKNPNLPSWFLEDEKKFFRSNIPVTKEAVNAIREKMRALDARPIKKVAEAKARKKMRAARRIEKLKKKAIGIQENENDLMTSGEKKNEIEKIAARIKGIGNGKGGKSKKDKVQLVVAKGVNRGNAGRPKGVKGRYKVRFFRALTVRGI
jgi:AdoMet-dependent rRNA methyltransferase SPB1